MCGSITYLAGNAKTYNVLPDRRNRLAASAAAPVNTASLAAAWLQMMAMATDCTDYADWAQNILKGAQSA